MSSKENYHVNVIPFHDDDSANDGGPQLGPRLGIIGFNNGASGKDVEQAFGKMFAMMGTSEEEIARDEEAWYQAAAERERKREGFWKGFWEWVRWLFLFGWARPLWLG